MKKLTIPVLTREISASHSKQDIIKYENLLVVKFTVSILFLASIVTVLSRQTLINGTIYNNSMYSFILIGLAFLFIFISAYLKNDRLKSNVFILLFSASQIFIVLRLYYIIGSAVWTFTAIMIVFSLLRSNNKMLIMTALTTFFLGRYIWVHAFEFQMGIQYYVAQNIAFTLLFIVAAIVHKIIINRQIKIDEQYQLLSHSEELSRLTLNAVGDGVISVDKNGKVNFMNPVAQNLTGWNQDDAYGKPFEIVFKIINEHTRAPIDNPISKVFETEEIIELANHTVLISKDGTERAIEDTAAPIKGESGNVLGVVLVFRDCGDKKEKRQLIEYLSYHDYLTGLYNRRFFEEELNRLDTVRNVPLSIVFADVNCLKTINDAFGHECGDRLIQKVAKILKQECRSDDIISRTGGDEFILLLPHTDSISVQKLVHRINTCIEKEHIMDISISVSFGWDTKANENQSMKHVLKNAENFMYQKKLAHNSANRSRIIQSILNTLYINNPKEKEHATRVSDLAVAIGKSYHLNESDLKELKTAGELHDIGKIALDDSILTKVTTLTDEDWAQIHLHSEIGYRITGNTNEYRTIAEFILSHHEKWNGEGYPKGLKGEEIPWKARVLCIADAYDAMTSDHPYRQSLSQAFAVSELKKNAGGQFDPDIAKTFVEKVLEMTW